MAKNIKSDIDVQNIVPYEPLESDVQTANVETSKVAVSNPQELPIVHGFENLVTVPFSVRDVCLSHHLPPDGLYSGEVIRRAESMGWTYDLEKTVELRKQGEKETYYILTR